MRLKDSNALLVTQKENKYAQTLKRIETTPFQDGLISTGNYILLRNIKTEGFLAVDIDDKSSNYEAAFAVTTNPLINYPCPRSLFKLEKYESKCEEPSPIVYGEKICIMTHSDINPCPLYLQSELVTPRSFSRFSRYQEVLANAQKSFNSAWTIEHPDSTLRYSMEGKPISVSDPFVIRHCLTGRLLASDLVEYCNDYGKEYEVCCNNFLTSNKYQTLTAEKEGRFKIDTKTRIEKEQNLWLIY